MLAAVSRKAMLSISDRFRSCGDDKESQALRMSKNLVAGGVGDDSDEIRWTHSGKQRVENHQSSFWRLFLSALLVSFARASSAVV